MIRTKISKFTLLQEEWRWSLLFVSFLGISFLHQRLRTNHSWCGEWCYIRWRMWKHGSGQRNRHVLSLRTSYVCSSTMFLCQTNSASLSLGFPFSAKYPSGIYPTSAYSVWARSPGNSKVSRLHWQKISPRTGLSKSSVDAYKVCHGRTKLLSWSSPARFLL